MSEARKIRCHTCDGTGVVEIITGDGYSNRSKEFQLRAELARLWDVHSLHEQFMKSIYEMAGAGITNLVSIINEMKAKIAELTKTIERLNNELAVYRDKSMAAQDGAAQDGAAQDGAAQDGTDTKSVKKITRAEYRRQVATYEAQKSGCEPGKDSKKKQSGGQPGHKGSSRKGAVNDTVRFPAQLCNGCGRADMIICIVRKKILDLSDKRQETIQKMYVMEKGLCPDCWIETLPHTDAIPGTSFGPRLRGHIHTYKDGHATEGDIRKFVKGLEDLSLSDGAISSCVSAIAKHMDGSVLTLRDEKPIILDPNDMCDYRSPLLPPPPDNTEYGQLDAAVTQRSTLWTSSMPQPAMVCIIERASMDPYVCSDESGARVGADSVQASVTNTIHTTQIRIIPRRDAKTLERIWGWMKNRPAMRDGTKGYEWHQKTARRARCMVHALRDTEESAMSHELGSPEYVRYREMSTLYHKAKKVRKTIIERAGGPIKCASQLNIIYKTKDLCNYLALQIRDMDRRISQIIDMSPPDSVRTLLANAQSDMLNALYTPGMPLQNNGTEQDILECIAVDRRRIIFPDMKGAYNFSVMKTFSATCKKNGIGVYRATIMMAKDPTWTVFNRGIPPPIFGTRDEENH